MRLRSIPQAWIWLSGWAAILFFEIFILDLFLRSLLHRNAPDIAAERSRVNFQKEQVSSDRLIQLLQSLAYVCMFATVGMDRRFGWSHFPAWLQIIGAAFIAITTYTTYRVALENKFAALTVKIQRSQGHKVISTGPYRHVRHPMYTGFIFGIVGIPLLLGSWWGFAPASASIALLIARIVFEERVLRAGLEGYDDYARSVAYRLIPLVW
jgi:protein-S-isoprenylcysteine O-methyltransferase Ste14